MYLLTVIVYHKKIKIEVYIVQKNKRPNFGLKNFRLTQIKFFIFDFLRIVQSQKSFITSVLSSRPTCSMSGEGKWKRSEIVEVDEETLALRLRRVFIEVGLFVRGLAKCCYELDSAAMPGHFEPIQLAVGSRGGCERAVTWSSLFKKSLHLRV
jgi:hypothetical protein